MRAVQLAPLASIRWLRSISAALISLAACKGAEHPHHVSSAGSQTIDVTRAGLALRAATSDGDQQFAAFSGEAGTLVEARRGGPPGVTWTAKLGGNASTVARAGSVVGVGLAGKTALDISGTSLALRGDPGAVLVGLDAKTGAVTYKLAIDSSDWSQITAIAALDSDFVVVGSFAGTLRIGTHVVSSAGGSDGFIARITPTGELVWLERIGGAGADAVQGVATAKDRIAIAGTFSTGADILGEPLKSFDERLPYGDAFAAELDPNGARRWEQTFGGRGDDTVAGVAIDARGNVVVAGSARETVHVGSNLLVTQGPGDGIVVWYGKDGEQGPAVLVGGPDFDGLRAITAIDDRVVVGGFFSGEIDLAGRKLTAGGGDDAFLEALDGNGASLTSWHVGGDGREDIVSLSPIGGGFLAAITHTTAANIDDETLPSPADPMTGAALVVRGL